MYTLLVGKAKGKNLLGRSRYRRKNDIHRDLEKMVCTWKYLRLNSEEEICT
jgi:hypothetical protein